MLNDALTRISGTVADLAAGTAAVPQDLGGVTTAGAYSTNGYLLSSDSNRLVGEGENLYVRFTIATEAISDNDDPDGTLTIELHALPGASTLNVQTFTVTAATDIVTPAEGTLPDGTCIVLTTTTTLPAGLALATHYYVVNSTSAGFQVALTPNGAVVDITGTGTGTHTATIVPTIVGSSGAVPFDRLTIGDSLSLRINPVFDSVDPPKGGALYAFYRPTGTLDTGMVFADIVHGNTTSKVYYKSGFTIA